MSPRILIIRVGAMGDVLHGLPAVAALRQALPESFIGWAIEPRWQALLRAGHERLRGPQMPIVDRVHQVHTQAWKREPVSLETAKDIARLRRELHAERYDLCIDLQGSIRSAAVGRISGARCFFGPEEPREALARLLYRRRVPLTQTHVIHQACELVAAGTSLPVAPAVVTLPRDVEAEVWAEHLFHAVTAPVALLVPSAGWGAKEWGTANYHELAASLHAAGLKILVNAAAPGDLTAHAIVAKGKGMIAATNLSQLIGLIRRASIVIGGDTGPVHLAAALGKPVVALFGPTDPARNGPNFPGARVAVLRDAGSKTSHKRVQTTEPGLARINVDEVIAAALALIAPENRNG
jgi:heptosyltransferase-1